MSLITFPFCHTDTRGTTYWHHNGVLHREDGPAVEYENGDKFWYFNGRGHRLDGPAIEFEDGQQSYYVYGVRYMDELTYWLAVTEWKKKNG